MLGNSYLSIANDAVYTYMYAKSRVLALRKMFKARLSTVVAVSSHLRMSSENSAF